MKLVYDKTGKEVHVGDIAKTFRGEKVEVTYFREPTHGSGKICVREVETGFTGEYYVGVIGASWIED